MKIVYVSDLLGAHDFRFLSKILENKHEVLLITYSPDMYTRETFRNSGFDVTKLPGLKIINEPALRWHNAKKQKLNKMRIMNKFTPVKNYYLLMRQAFHFKKILKEIKPDIVHTGWVHTSGFLAAFSGFHPFVLMPWGSDILIEPFVSKINRTVTRFVIKKADRITCDCNLVKERIVELAHYPTEKIIIIPWGVDLKLFNTFNSNSVKIIKEKLGWEQKKILIMTRTFREIYGIEYFLRALPQIINNCKDVRIILVGTGPKEKELKNLAMELNVNQYIHWAGYISGKDVSFYLRTSDIYLSTSLSDGSSVSLLEAMACGLPVVVSDTPGNLEWIENGKGGYIVPQKEIRPISESVCRLLKDSSLRENMGSHNLAVVENRADWDKNFNKLEEIYTELQNSRYIYRTIEMSDSREFHENTVKEAGEIQGKVLDAGCGYGHLIKIITARNPNTDIYGLDISFKMSKESGKLVKVSQGDIQKMPFKNNVFDMIFCVGAVLSYVSNPQAGIEEMSRVLKTGGKIIISVPNYNYHLILRIKSRIMNGKYLPPTDHCFFFT